jgi:DNA-binding NarL/FixJ family response regulator
MTTIRVVLADDHLIVRAGIRAVLERIEGIVIVGEASNGREALALVEQFLPQVLLTDIAMPELNGLELTARISLSHPRVRVIILSMHSAEEYVRQALRAGAAGYLLKDSDAGEIERAVIEVAAGRSYLAPSLSTRVIGNYLKRLGPGADPAEILTPRQREILQAIAGGKSTKETALALGISVKTVETHRAQLMDRLKIDNVPGLVRYAMRTGMISPDR